MSRRRKEPALPARLRRPRALRYVGASVQKVISRVDTAAECIGPLEPGVHITGATAGQFSAIDAVEHMVEQLHPCSVRVSTWTTGIYDVERLQELKFLGLATDVRFLLDRATFEKSPQFAGPMIERFGVDTFRCCAVHAKVIVVDGGPGRRAAWRSSMNLNKNLRTENFDISVDDGIAEFWGQWFDGLWDWSGRSRDNRAIIQAVYDRWLSQGSGGAASDPHEGAGGGSGLITAEEFAAWFGD
ncbi:hypothetical protein SAMN05216257_10497 [Meinhardsimonia xiamenensis]|jgi:hypothetical protein|uniref:PLD-like domain-containing protein n=1 Tax=Meinhardsimonia xiamenensis TaxID=990712 RepID=A0A1G9E0F7_9RHOB|nr:hypothetical protein [Meinhardsimonia xiamenensis]PRX29016.1 hypothetical protein LV81_02960 [Meinhardsimonia xiamenensis]SDK69530.1 hypothetical protein SAMN05216257_10497 [Meinhardsimonia xiamenensis]